MGYSNENLVRVFNHKILFFFQDGEDNSSRYSKNQHQFLWKAPEFLREVKFTNFTTTPNLGLILSSPTIETNSTIHANYRVILSAGSQKGDVYSFGIILYEIMGRQGPWGRGRMTSKEAACK